jgi:DNA-binding GntR family transcriptional regulator
MVTGTPSDPSVHGDLYAAIAAHDVDRALAAMQQHLTDMVTIVEE